MCPGSKQCSCQEEKGESHSKQTSGKLPDVLFPFCEASAATGEDTGSCTRREEADDDDDGDAAPESAEVEAM